MFKVFFNTIRRYNLKYPWTAILYIALAVVAASAEIIMARASGNLAQTAELGLSTEMMSFLLIIAFAGAVQTLMNVFTAIIKQRRFGKSIHSIRNVFVRKLLHMPYKDFALKNSGEGTTLFTTDAPLAAEFVSTQILSQASQFVTLFVTIVFMLFINWWLTLIYFALFPLLAIMQTKISAPIVEKSKEASERQAECVAVVSDALQNPLIVKAYGLEASVERRFNMSFAEYHNATYNAVLIRARLLLAGVVMTILPTFALGAASAALAINGDITIADFIVLTIISGPAGSWLMMLAQDLARLRQASASSLRVMGFTPDTAAENERASSITHYLESSVHAMQGAPKYAAAFDKVSFSYTKEAKVLEDTTFTVDNGSITAIAGPSGCGKSTVLKLLLGLYAPESGKISLSSPNITYVPQDCYLLPVTIMENIIGSLPYDENRFREACECAGILDYITSLPEGPNSVLSESAANISGGQKQRIAMARAFYRDADILLLDEATSSLDPVTDQAVLSAFADYIKHGGKTAITVAHRQSVLDMSDRVITLAKGGVAI